MHITNKLLVGLTGGIGSGKSCVANGFAGRGASVIDADAISHELTVPGGAAIPAIRLNFGEQMITPQGALDRAKMRDLIFANANQKTRLEAILHPMIRSEMARQTEKASGPYLVYVIPLLVESGQWTKKYEGASLQRILVVDCDEALQIQRVMQRDGLSEQLVKSILAQQATRAQRLAIATDVIHNQTTIEALNPEIDHLHQLFCRLGIN